MELLSLDVQGHVVNIGDPALRDPLIQVFATPGIGGSSGVDRIIVEQTWSVTEDADGWSATLEFPSTNILIQGSALDADTGIRIAAGLVVKESSELPIDPLGPGLHHTTVARHEADGVRTTMAVAGGNNGRYSVETESTGGSSSAASATFFDPADVVTAEGGGGMTSMEGSNVVDVRMTGFATSAVEAVEIEFVDGQVVTVPATDLSGKFDDRFWVVRADIEPPPGEDLNSLASLSVEVRARDVSGDVIGTWQVGDQLGDVVRTPPRTPVDLSPTNDLVAERRAPTAAEMDRLDEDGEGGVLDCEMGGAGTWDYDAIGPDDPTARTSDDALVDAFDELANVPTSGWTELLFGLGDSTFIHTIDDWRAIVEVGGDPELGVWRPFAFLVCAPDDL